MEDRPERGTRARACKSQAGKARDDGDVEDEEEEEKEEEEKEEKEEEKEEEGEMEDEDEEERASESGGRDSDSDFEDAADGGPGQCDLSEGHLTIDRDHCTFDSERR